MNFFHRGINKNAHVPASKPFSIERWILKHIIDFESFTLKEKTHNLVPDSVNKYESDIYNMGHWIYIYTTTLNVRRTFFASPVKEMFMISSSSIQLVRPSKLTHILQVNLEVRPSIKVAKQLPPAFPNIETSLCLYPFTGIKTLRPQILWKDGPFSMESINVVKSNHMYYRYINRVNNLKTMRFVIVYFVE